MLSTPTKKSKPLEGYNTPPTKKPKINTEKPVILPNGQTITVYCINPSNATKEQIENAKLRQSRQGSSKKCSFYTMKTIPREQDPSYEENAARSFDDREYLTLPNANVVKLFRFVITASGELICGPNDPEEYVSHGAMVEDAPVFAAGEFGMNEANKLCYVSNRTGHYRIPPTTLALVYSYLIDTEGYSADEIKEIYEGRYTIGKNDSLDYSIQKVGDLFVYHPSAFGDTLAQPSEYSTDSNDENSLLNHVLNTDSTLFYSPPPINDGHHPNNSYILS